MLICAFLSITKLTQKLKNDSNEKTALKHLIIIAIGMFAQALQFDTQVKSRRVYLYNTLYNRLFESKLRYSIKHDKKNKQKKKQ